MEEVADVASYEIAFGEIGFTVLRDGKIRYVSVPSRTEARALISAERKRDQEREMARLRVRQLFERLRDDFQIPATELITIFQEEAKL